MSRSTTTRVHVSSTAAVFTKSLLNVQMAAACPTQIHTPTVTLSLAALM